MKLQLCLLIDLTLVSATAGYSQVVLNSAPSRVVGQPQLALVSANPNLVEGREFYSPQGIALDTSATPPILYVADTINNRVLAWRNATGFSNGVKADLVIGQRDFFSTLAQGPGTAFQSGLNFPTGLAVDANGNLYVVDSGNNRVLRFPKPFSHTDFQFPDLYIGQPNLNSRNPNYTGAISASGIATNVNNQPYRASVAFDGAGNLWLTDPANRRVLRFTKDQLAAGGGPLVADTVLGQTAFNPTTLQTLTSNQTKSLLAIPSGLAFDSLGRLYVSDSDPNNPNGLNGVSRVLIFEPPYFNGKSAARIMGVVPAPAGGGQPSQDTIDRTIMVDPEGIIILPGGAVGVVDSQSSRILFFDAYEQWPPEGTAFSPTARAAFGQNDFNNRNPNSGQATPSGITLAFPVAATVAGNQVYIADSLNNRVIVSIWSGPSGSGLGTLSNATRVLGQVDYKYNSVNLIEGREFDFVAQTSLGASADGDVIVDASDPNTPHLYVADTYNNRVLGFRDLRKIGPGSRADIVIGQPDMLTALCNYNGVRASDSSPDKPNQYGLCRPIGLTVDSKGNLYVADSANGRVLRFPTPFAQPVPLPQADLVIGQPDFVTKITDPSPRTMNTPYGVALAGDRGLLVSDLRHNRVLFFPLTNGTFSNGEAATKVFGQPDFFSVGSGNDDASLSSPHHIAADSDTRPYVVDSGNNRVLIFDRVFNAAGTGAHASQIIPGIGAPRGIHVSPATGEVFVGDFNGNRILRYPRYDQLVLNNTSATIVPAYAPIAASLDQYGDLFVADAANRVTIYFPALQTLNGATFLTTEPLAPGAVASICSPGSACVNGTALFGTDTAAAQNLPLPNTLADVQVLFNGQPTPLYYVSPTQINFVVPMGKNPGDVPTSGFADLQVVKVSTGQILATGQVPMNVASPGIIRLQ